MTRRAIPAEIDRRVREAAQNRCGYCLSPQHLVMARLEVEYMIPLAKGGTNDELNLWLACPICNGHKSDKTEAVDGETGAIVPLFHPRTQVWSDHFVWSADGIRIVGTTPVGRATVAALHLSDDPDALEVRSYWVLAGIRPRRRRAMRTEGRGVACLVFNPLSRWLKDHRRAPQVPIRRCNHYGSFTRREWEDTDIESHQRSDCAG